MYYSLTLVAQGNNFLKRESSEERSSIIYYPQDDTDGEEHTFVFTAMKT